MWQTAPSRGQRCKCHLSGETVQGFYLQQCSPKQLMWKEIQISALKSVQIKTFQFNLESWSSIGYVPGLTAYELISVAARHKRKTKVSSMY